MMSLEPITHFAPLMPLQIGWLEVAERMTLACAAGLLIGYNRDEHGRPAGMRTITLVTLTATLSMLLVNLFLMQAGKQNGSFIQLDLMRLPLGVLSGIGFIGAGAIIKREEGTVGVTTAATLWFTTMLGLIFGAGLLLLGTATTLIGYGILTTLRKVELRILRERHGVLTLTLGEDAPTEAELRARIVVQPLDIQSWTVQYTEQRLERIRCDVQWRANAEQAPHTPASIAELRELPGVTGFHWEQ